MRAVLLVALLLVGCSNPDSSAVLEGENIRRFHDGELGVTCWYVPGGYQGGIDCIPDSDLP